MDGKQVAISCALLKKANIILKGKSVARNAIKVSREGKWCRINLLNNIAVETGMLGKTSTTS